MAASLDVEVFLFYVTQARASRSDIEERVRWPITVGNPYFGI
jgi:hypothetical protein